RRQGAIHRLEHFHEVARQLDGTRHVGFAEIEVRIPEPTEERRAIAKAHRADDRTSRRGQFKTVPECELNRRCWNSVLNAAERPAIERSRCPGRNDVRDGRNREWMIVHGSLLDRLSMPHAKVVLEDPFLCPCGTRIAETRRGERLMHRVFLLAAILMTSAPV